MIEEELKANDVTFSMFSSLGGYRPDFLINHNDQKVIIECDGLYWHSDKFKSSKYHIEKKNFYKQNSIFPLFFRENEILTKFSIVSSILRNRLKLNEENVYARKCELITLRKVDAKKYFSDNHLMGFGSGEVFALKFNDAIVAAIQVRWRKLSDKILEVSRFCTKKNVSVVGGFGKLLKVVLEKFEPNKIITFVDERYGSGDYLKIFKFEKKTNSPSFAWTDGHEVFHRMTFRGNSGYEKGFYKIWDCGQAKWELTLKEKK